MKSHWDINPLHYKICHSEEIICFIDIVEVENFDNLFRIEFDDRSERNYEKLFKAKYGKTRFSLVEIIIAIEEFIIQIENLQAFE